ncbi:MAG: NADH-quinone oxidoreductase subunit L, partial [Actinomyces sp.]|nr:NADH-quinone oxidoreductase subunit L [Actinomyces sp.]
MTTFISPQATGVPDTVAATGVAAYAWLLILIPLASAGLLLLLGRASDKWGHLLATLASWSTFVVGALIAAQMWNAP